MSGTRMAVRSEAAPRLDFLVRVQLLLQEHQVHFGRLQFKRLVQEAPWLYVASKFEHTSFAVASMSTVGLPRRRAMMTEPTASTQMRWS